MKDIIVSFIARLLFFMMIDVALFFLYAILFMIPTLGPFYNYQNSPKRMNISNLAILPQSS